MDVNHQEVFFPEEYFGKALSLTFRLWSGLEGGGVPAVQEHQIKSRPGLAGWEVDDFTIWEPLVLESIENLDENDPVRYDLRNALDEACTVLTGHIREAMNFMSLSTRADRVLNGRLTGWMALLW